MGRIDSYEDLIAWRKAYQLVLRLYEFTARFPVEERFGLAQQIRRAAVSVPSNIAEGWGRGTTQDYVRFLKMARGSIYEVQTQVRLAEDLGLISSKASIGPDIAEVERVLNGLIRSLTSQEMA